MYKTHFYPLRSVIGTSIPIRSALVFTPIDLGLDIVVTPRASLNDTIADPLYRHFFPDITSGGVTYRPIQGLTTLPVPPVGDRPFPSSDPLYSFFGVPHTPLDGSEPNAIGWPNIDRRGPVTLLIQLDEEALVGGICYGGCPYVSAALDVSPSGTTVANHALPHELRLTPLPSLAAGTPADVRRYARTEFLDAEFAYTAQTQQSPSSFQFLCIDPVRTNFLTLTLSDFPKIGRFVDLDAVDGAGASAPHVSAFYGFAMPYCYVFRYRESTRRAARLRTGVVGVRNTFATAPASNSPDALFPEYAFRATTTSPQDGVYAHFSAHSAFGQRRIYELSYGYPTLGDAQVDLPDLREPVKGFEECFVSPLLQHGDRVCVYLQQGEEFDRCVAGLKALFLMAPGEPLAEGLADLVLSRMTSTTTFDGQLTGDERSLVEDVIAYYARLPAETNFCEAIQISVFEIDPPEGVAPASIGGDSRYATLIHRSTIGGVLDLLFATFLQGLKFTRTSSARYFAVELENTGIAAGQIAIHSLSLIRSAHVAVQPRAARAQQIKTLHYRIVGPDLAEDYAQLGGEGFNFSIDRIVGGQARQVLYGAASLLDLLHTGNARLHQNVRRRAVEFERTESFIDAPGLRRGYEVRQFANDDLSLPNIDRREVDTASLGWREVESGKDVVWPLERGAPDFDVFENYSGSEVRSRVEYLSSLLDKLIEEFERLATTVNNRIEGMVSLVVRPDHNVDRAITAADVLFRNEIGPANFQGIWKPYGRFGFSAGLPAIEGLHSLNIPPYFLSMLDSMTALTKVITALTSGGLDVENLTRFTTDELDKLMAKLAFVNGIGLGMNVGVNSGAGVTLGPVNVSGGTSGGYSLSTSSNMVTAARSMTTGSQGTINLVGQEVKYSMNRSKQRGFDTADSSAWLRESESKRIVSRREVAGRDDERIRGAEVLWQGLAQDIVTGSVPVNLTLPATASKSHMRTPDEGLRVRFNSGFAPSIDVDFWFELIEEPIRDDY